MSIPDLKSGQNNHRLVAVLRTAERDLHHALHCALAGETGSGAVRHAVRNFYADANTAKAIVEGEL